MANPIFGIGISGLNAAQAGLLTTGQNISNVNTPGYNRQEIVQAASLPQYTGSGFLGRGVSVTGIRRAYDSLLQDQAWQAQSSAKHFESLSAQISRVDGLLANAEGGIAPALAKFFGSIQDLAAHPSDAAARQGVLANGRAMAGRFRELNDQLDIHRNDINGRMANVVEQASSLSGEIAALNQRILTLGSGSSAMQPPNDLLDLRDRMVGDLSVLVRTQVVVQEDGSYNVFLSNGQPLVVKEGSNQLRLVADAEDLGRMRVALHRPSGLTMLRSTDLQGGQLGGLLEFRDDVLDPAQNGLGRIATNLASAFNAQHRLGQDLNGSAGVDFFTAASPRVMAREGNSGGAGLAAVITDASLVTISDYRLTWDGASHTVTRLSDGNQTVSSSFPISVDGLRLDITAGALVSGDSFLIQPTRGGAAMLDVKISDIRRIASAAPVRTAANPGNAGSGAISPGSVNYPPPVNADLLQPVAITFTSSSSFEVSGTGTGNPTGVAYAPGTEISFNGWTIRLDGVPAPGDVFTVEPNTGGVGDNRNALALAALQLQSLVMEAGSTLQGAYAQMVSEVGNRAQEARISSSAQDGLLASVDKARQTASAVNLDEEAANLLRYQQAYQAAGKVVALASTLFETILSLG